MFDVWDILANAIGGLLGIAVRMLFDMKNRNFSKEKIIKDR